jgi:hypothetical protein
MPLNYDPISALLWAVGQIIAHGLVYAAIAFPFVFVALWSLKRLAQSIFPAPKPTD